MIKTVPISIRYYQVSFRQYEKYFSVAFLVNYCSRVLVCDLFQNTITKAFGFRSIARNENDMVDKLWLQGRQLCGIL